MVIWKMVFRSVAQRPDRAILTLLSVVCGVTAVVSVWIAVRTSRVAYKQMFGTVAGAASLEVVSKLGDTFDEATLEKISDVVGVTTATPVIRKSTNLSFAPPSDDSDEATDDSDAPKKSNRLRVALLGVDPDEKRDPQIRNIEIIDGKYFTRDADGNWEDGVLLEENIAKKLGVKVGQEVKAKTKKFHNEPLTVVGIYQPKGAAAFSQGTVVLMPLVYLQERLDSEGEIDSIQIAVDEVKYSVALVRNEIEGLLPSQLRVRSPELRSSSAEETSLSTEMGLNMGWAFSLMVAVFIIMNTFLMNVTERRRQLAIMRAIGAQQSQIGAILLREAVMMGVVGTAIGSAVGVLAAGLLTKSLGKLYASQLPAAELSWEPFVIAFCFGVGISLIGSWIPARRAMKLSPLEAMSAVLAEDVNGRIGGVTAFGLLVSALSIGIIQACLHGFLPIEISIWATVALLFGFVMMLPAVLGIVSKVIEVLLRVVPQLRTEVTLARRQLLRQRSRTTLTVGVLFVAVATGTGLASAILDNVNDVRGWAKKVLLGDFYIRATVHNAQDTTNASLPDELVKEVESLKERGIVRVVDTTRHYDATFEGQSLMFVARDFPSKEELHFDMFAGRDEQLYDKVCNGEVILGSVASQRIGKGVNDEVDFPDRDGNIKKVRVAAVVNDYMGGGLTLYMKRDQAAKLVNSEGVDVIVVKVNKEKLAEAEAEIRKIVDKFEVVFQSNAEVSKTIDGMMVGVVASLYALLGLSMLVAAFGVVNTLTMNVIEQTRQLGMLRVVAMTRSQVRKLILSQAAIIGMSAVPTAVGLGLIVAYWINQSTIPVLGHPVKFDVHPGLLAIGLFGSLFIVFTAAWLPARRAANLDLVTAMHYE